MRQDRVRTAVLISGTGSNMEALIRAAEVQDYPASIDLVIANRPDARGVQTARDHGIEAVVIDHTDFPDRPSFEAAIDEKLRHHNIELVALAGFMRVLTEGFVRGWEGRLVNIHPSLLPRHKGLHTHRRALEAGDGEHGATVHWVVPELDSGETILQAGFPIPDGATEATLRHTVQLIEHTLYPEALAIAASEIAARNFTTR